MRKKPKRKRSKIRARFDDRFCVEPKQENRSSVDVPRRPPNRTVALVPLRPRRAVAPLEHVRVRHMFACGAHFTNLTSRLSVSFPRFFQFSNRADFRGCVRGRRRTRCGGRGTPAPEAGRSLFASVSNLAPRCDWSARRRWAELRAAVRGAAAILRVSPRDAGAARATPPSAVHRSPRRGRQRRRRHRRTRAPRPRPPFRRTSHGNRGSAPDPPLCRPAASAPSPSASATLASGGEALTYIRARVLRHSVFRLPRLFRVRPVGSAFPPPGYVVRRCRGRARERHSQRRFPGADECR